VRKELNALVANKFVVALSGRLATLPTLYTLTGKGGSVVAAFGMGDTNRVRKTEERDKAQNMFFVKHTVAVSDVLIAALLLSHTQPGIVLTRLYTERFLKRKIYVKIPAKICIEPDASVEFTINEQMQDFYHLEVYRTLPPAEWRFKQKIAGYVTYAATGQHEEDFQTPALGIAVFCQTFPMAQT
jgi:hypothetical protein